MAESTLSIGLDYFRAAVGTYLGFGRGAVYGEPAWDDRTSSVIDDCVASGIRQFLTPPPVTPGGASYDWSFLRPVANISLPQGVQSVQLPDDFGGVAGEAVLSQATAQITWRLKYGNPDFVRQLYAQEPSASGKPLHLAIEPAKDVGALQGQRFNLLVFPIPDAAYTLQVTYYILPDMITGAHPFPYGGSAHAETILASCLAIAERRRDNMVGEQNDYWKERLAASMARDRLFKPQDLGRNADRSDDNRYTRRGLHNFPPLATYNGVSFQ